MFCFPSKFTFPQCECRYTGSVYIKQLCSFDNFISINQVFSLFLVVRNRQSQILSRLLFFFH